MDSYGPTHPQAEREWLDKDELRELTDRSRVTAQAAWLRDNGIPFRQPGPRRLIVCRIHVRAWVAGQAMASVSSGGLNWSTVS